MHPHKDIMEPMLIPKIKKKIAVWGTSKWETWLSEKGCLIGCTPRLKVQTQWEKVPPELGRLRSDDSNGWW